MAQLSIVPCRVPADVGYPAQAFTVRSGEILATITIDQRLLDLYRYGPEALIESEAAKAIEAEQTRIRNDIGNVAERPSTKSNG